MVAEMIKEFQGEYRWLSNFWPVDIEYEGLQYPSVEHAYQAAKFLDCKIREEFTYGSPGRAKRLTRQKGLAELMRTDWDNVKLSIMLDLTRKKYRADKGLATKLINTGDMYIEEGNTWGDKFWGVCKGRGANNLGLIIMTVREELRNEFGL